MPWELIDDILGFGKRHGTQPLFSNESPTHQSRSISNYSGMNTNQSTDSFIAANMAYGAIMASRMRHLREGVDYRPMRQSIEEILEDIFTQAHGKIPAIADLESVTYSMSGEERKYHARWNTLEDTKHKCIKPKEVTGSQAHKKISRFASRIINRWEQYEAWKERVGHPHREVDYKTLIISSWNISQTFFRRKLKLAVDFEVDDPGLCFNNKNLYRFEIIEK